MAQAYASWEARSKAVQMNLRVMRLCRPLPFGKKVCSTAKDGLAEERGQVG